jgi:hypothetical protein
MKLSIVVLLVACTGSQPPATDRLDCVSCHQAEFDNAPNATSACTKKPDHVALHYSTKCYTCHGTATPDPDPDPTITRSGWCPAVDPDLDRKQHDVFLISTGSHAGYGCDDCHKSPGLVIGQSLTNQAAMPQPTECTSCHWPHDKASTDAHHLGKSGYTYGPSTCLASDCHANGRRQ